MARLLDWPVGVGIRAWEPLAGPPTIGAGSTTSVGNFMQTFASPYGGWAYQFTLPACKDQAARRLRGWITAMHGGANATRVPWYDADVMSLEDAGAKYTPLQIRDGMPWGNDQPWANDRNWAAQYPLVPVAEASALGSTFVKLGSAFWGHVLDMGDEFGFNGHFGKYMVIEVIEPGWYRIWPQLRRAVTADDVATLEPVMAMRMMGADAASLSRDTGYMPETVISLYEVEDYYVRDYFTE
ncbi:hypothetical protein ACQ3G6_13245 [Allorhizobium undicola]|uniref:hypothetical protein n=1 Tax=Allorhizobium undicola TaxID=78527 RepID=UPI003D3293B4